MAQGDIYSINVRLKNTSRTGASSSEIVSIDNDSIVLSAIVSIAVNSDNSLRKYGKIELLNSNSEFMHRFFYKRQDSSQDWELIELPAMKKLKVNAGEQLQFIAHADYDSSDPYDDTIIYLNAKITLMEV